MFNDLINKTSSINTSPSIITYLNYIKKLLEEKNWNEINKIFIKIRLQRTSPLLIVTLLKSTYIYRDKITTWKEMLKETELELNEKQMNTKKILKGLK